MTRLVALFVVCTNLSTGAVVASQGSEPILRSPEYWYAYASKLPSGSTVRVRTVDVHRETAVLAGVDRDGIMLERAGEAASPLRIEYANLTHLELQKQGSGVGKTIAIGAAIGAAAFVGFLVFIATAMN